MLPRFLQLPGVPLATSGSIAGLLLAGFLWDLTTPLGYVPWLLYLPALLLTLALPARWAAPALAGLCTLLILLGHVNSPLKGGGNAQAAIFNRTLGIAMLWLMAGSCLLYKRAEDRLREKDARFRVIFEQAAVGVAQIDTATGRFVQVNQRYCEIVGLSAEQMTASTFMDLTHAADLQEDLDNMARLVAGDIHTFTMDKRYVRPDGSIVWVTLTVSPMWAPGDQPDYHIAVVEDITLRKQAEAGLVQLQLQHETILQAAGEGIYGLDTEGRVTFVNQAAARMTGWQVEDLMGQPMHRLVHHSLADGTPYAEQACPIVATIRTGAGQRSDSDVFWRKDGTNFTAEYVTSPIRLADGSLGGAVVTFQDISERKQAEEQRRRSHAQLQALAAHLETVREQERIRIARELHDELGQTLTGLKMDLAQLSKGLAAKPTTDERSHLLNKAHEMQNLIDASVRDIRRLVLELRPPVLDHSDLSGALEWLTRDFQKRHGIACRFTCVAPPDTIEADAQTALFRIAQEALTNVARHAHATQVHIELAGTAEALQLTIADDGRGFDETETTKPTAFGLTGIKERARLLDGAVSCQSRSGRGTQIMVRIPMRRPT
ncbi:MAG: PAS domain S-box protein [Nitrospirae bacterium]|nr:MAG: PAS domain S-box protein [Nitrospirota bacterium]